MHHCWLPIATGVLCKKTLRLITYSVDSASAPSYVYSHLQLFGYWLIKLFVSYQLF